MRIEERLDRIERLIGDSKALLSDSSPATDSPKSRSVRAHRPEFPALPAVRGVELASTSAAIKTPDRQDVMLVRAVPNSVVAGVFTRSATRSAAVLDCEQKLRQAGGMHGPGVVILANSGNANAFTGAAGTSAVASIAGAIGGALELPPEHVFTASTGVIGEALPEGRITAVIGELVGRLSTNGIKDAAHAIMTTDSFPKGAGHSLDVPGGTVTISGIAKGSGMIAPDMATMLAFIFTDATIAQDNLQSMVSELAETSFNSVTVDGDTSTSDTVLVVATGQSEAAPVDGSANAEFRQALGEVMTDLAKQIARDGEGASKFVEIRVSGAASLTDARRVAKSIANSPLVKTAIAGEDPNWGRIVMAVGKSGAQADRDRLAIWFGDHLVAEQGCVADTYSEAMAAEHMRGGEIEIKVDLGVGDATSRVWTCDLTADYVAINADYRS